MSILINLGETSKYELTEDSAFLGSLQPVTPLVGDLDPAVFTLFRQTQTRGHVVYEKQFLAPLKDVGKEWGASGEHFYMLTSDLQSVIEACKRRSVSRFSMGELIVSDLGDESEGAFPATAEEDFAFHVVLPEGVSAQSVDAIPSTEAGLKNQDGSTLLYRGQSGEKWFFPTPYDLGHGQLVLDRLKWVASNIVTHYAVPTRMRLLALLDGFLETFPEAMTATFLSLAVFDLPHTPLLWGYIANLSLLLTWPMTIMLRNWIFEGFASRLPESLALHARLHPWLKGTLLSHALAPHIYVAAVVQSARAVSMGPLQMIFTAGSQLCLQYMKSTFAYMNYASDNNVKDVSRLLRWPITFFESFGLIEVAKNLWTFLEWMIHVIGYKTTVDTLQELAAHNVMTASPLALQIFSLKIAAIVLGTAQTPFTYAYDIPRFEKLRVELNPLFDNLSPLLEKIRLATVSFFRHLTRDPVLQGLINGSVLNIMKVILLGPTLALLMDAVIKTGLGFCIGARGGLEAFRILSHLELVDSTHMLGIVGALGMGYGVLNAMQSYAKWTATYVDLYFTRYHRQYGFDSAPHGLLSAIFTAPYYYLKQWRATHTPENKKKLIGQVREMEPPLLCEQEGWKALKQLWRYESFVKTITGGVLAAMAYGVNKAYQVAGLEKHGFIPAVGVASMSGILLFIAAVNSATKHEKNNNIFIGIGTVCLGIAAVVLTQGLLPTALTANGLINSVFLADALVAVVAGYMMASLNATVRELHSGYREGWDHFWRKMQPVKGCCGPAPRLEAVGIN